MSHITITCHISLSHVTYHYHMSHITTTCHISQPHVTTTSHMSQSHVTHYTSIIRCYTYENEKMMSTYLGLNPRPSASKSNALPLSYITLTKLGHMCLLYNEVKRRRARLALGWVTAWHWTHCSTFLDFVGNFKEILLFWTWNCNSFMVNYLKAVYYSSFYKISRLSDVEPG